MGVIFQDDFESGGLAAGGWINLTGYSTAAYVAANGNQGRMIAGSYYLATQLYAGVKKDLGASYPYLGLQVIFHPYVNVYYGELAAFFDGSTKLLTIRRLNSTTLRVYLGYNSAVLGDITINPHVNHVLDVFVDPDPVEGVLQAKVDGVLKLNLTGVQTAPSGHYSVSAFSLGYSSTTTGGAYTGAVVLDNVRVSDSGFVDDYPASDLAPGNKYGDNPNCFLAWEFDFLNYHKSLSADYDFPYNLGYSDRPGGYERVNPLKGGCSAHLNQYVCYTWSDSALPNGFPFKSGDTDKQGTFVFWYRNDTFVSSSSYDGVALLSKGCGYNYTDGAFQFYIDDSTYELKARWSYRTGIETFTVSTLVPGRVYFFAFVIDGVGRRLHIRIYDKTAGAVNNYDFYPAHEINTASTKALYFNVSGWPLGGDSSDCLVDGLAMFKGLLSNNDIDDLRNDQYSPIPRPPRCTSVTTCGDIGLIPPPLRSHTTCEALTAPAMGTMRSVTTCQPLVKALPSTCKSRTTCGNIQFDGGDFFLAF